MPHTRIHRARPRTLTIALAAVLCAAILPASASAKLSVGIGDNSPQMFDDPNFQSLGTKISRKVIPYDFYKSPWELQQLDAWIAGAQRTGVEPLISLHRSETNPRKLPSVAEFKLALTQLMQRYPQVRTISPWNEANHVTQPTYKNPKRAAEYYNATRSLCKGCRIVAADVLDQKNMIPWVKAFKKTAKKPSIWGLHSYADSNKSVAFKKSATKKLLDNVKGKVWLTEVGGLVAFKNNYPYNESRGSKATSNTFKLAKGSKRIERIYFYSWYGSDHSDQRAPFKWDSGFVSPGGHPRPAFDVLKNWLGAHG